MADALASALVGIVLGNLNSDILQEIGLAWGLKDELNDIESVLSTIQLVVQDAEIKQRKDPVVQNWLRKLKQAAYDAENVLDRIATESLRRRANSERGMHHRITSFLFMRNSLLFRFKIAHKVRNVRQRLDAVAEERTKFHLREVVIDNGVVENRQTSSLVNESEVYGRAEEKEILVEKILNCSHDQEDLSVFSICGMGGLGKTTLAQLVYNEERVVTHFELRIWVCVSDDFSIHRLVRAMIESITVGQCDVSELDMLQRLLQEKLRGKRFLLVLDDVWSENHRQWDELKQALICGSKGSAVMVTTRIEKVAIMMSSLTIYKLDYLSEDDSWSLFRKRAFASEEEEVELSAIGKAIVKKCGGVPLAVKALGSLMRFKRHESEWLAIKESEIWHLTDDENGILPALRLSYDNLPPQMRQCFAYCCIFPKDFVMKKDELIQLWMANGFLPFQGQRDLQLTGHLIFKELVWRSFLQVVNESKWGDMTCKMHDLMHDLAKSIIGPETFILEHGKPKIPKILRHLSYFDLGASRAVVENKGKLKMGSDISLRSLIVHGRLDPAWEAEFGSFFSRQHYLRVLYVNHYIIGNVPFLFYRLKHLWYLTMSCYGQKRLPESLTYLYNLRTLKLINSGKLVELPRGLRHMKNLWVLDIDHFHSLQHMPPGLGELTYLQKLSIFIVGEDPAYQINQLKDLDLGGRLSIQGLDNVRSFKAARSANLMKKKYLISLSLAWANDNKEESSVHIEKVLEGLQPHHNLEEICIKSYRGSRFPNWISNELKNLTEISLSDCKSCEHLPTLGKLQSLKVLELHDMDSIKHLNAEWHGNVESSFPALTGLTLSGMQNLEEWTLPDPAASFPCLRNLNIEWCPKLIGLPVVSSPYLTSLRIMYCPKLCELPALPSLRSLTAGGNNATFLRSIVLLTSLTSLYIDFDDLHELSGGVLQNHKALECLQICSSAVRTLSHLLDDLSGLKKLEILSCYNLECLPEGLKYLGSLDKLEVRGCGSLTSFPATILQYLSSLRSLSIGGCTKLTMPLSGPLQREITSLQNLSISGCPEMKYLPESMKYLTELRRLDILRCEGLCSLPDWIENFQGLSEMSIQGNKKLNSLPDTFHNLKSLKKLKIDGCPLLEKRCKKPRGKDWTKISHIPRIRINWKIVQYLDL